MCAQRPTFLLHEPTRDRKAMMPLARAANRGPITHLLGLLLVVLLAHDLPQLLDAFCGYPNLDLYRSKVEKVISSCTSSSRRERSQEEREEREHGLVPSTPGTHLHLRIIASPLARRLASRPIY